MPIDPSRFEDVAVPSASFSFRTQWIGGSGSSIGFTLYHLGGTVYHHGFDKKRVSGNEWKYEAWFPEEVACYVLAKPVKGYQIRYENTGIYASITDRCCNGGTIIYYRIPRTGDSASPALWIGCTLAGIALVSALLITDRKKNACR